jgi:hypothetical protein
LKKHKPWFDEECLYFSDQRKQATIRWAQETNQSNDNNIKKCKTWSKKTFQEHKKEYLKAKLDELETNSKI